MNQPPLPRPCRRRRPLLPLHQLRATRPHIAVSSQPLILLALQAYRNLLCFVSASVAARQPRISAWAMSLTTTTAIAATSTSTSILTRIAAAVAVVLLVVLGLVWVALLVCKRHIVTVTVTVIVTGIVIVIVIVMKTRPPQVIAAPFLALLHTHYLIEFPPWQRQRRPPLLYTQGCMITLSGLMLSPRPHPQREATVTTTPTTVVVVVLLEAAVVPASLCLLALCLRFPRSYLAW